MPYIPVTNEADRRFAADADKTSLRVSNDTGWRGETIFSDNMAVLNSLPGQQRLNDMMMARSQILEHSQRTRGIIAKDDKQQQDEEEFNAFNEGLGVNASSESYVTNLGNAYTKNPSNPYLKAAHEAAVSSIKLGEDMKENVFKAKTRELGVIRTGSEMEDEIANRAIVKESKLAANTLNLAKIKDASAQLQVDFDGTLYDFQQEMGASGLPDEHLKLLGRISSSLEGTPEFRPAMAALTRLVRGFSLKDRANPFLASLAEAHSPALLAIMGSMGKRKNTKPMSPFETDPEAVKRRDEVLKEMPGLSNEWESIQTIRQMSEDNQKTVESLKVAMPSVLQKILVNTGVQTPEAQRALKSDIGALTMLSNRIAGGVAKAAREYDTHHKVLTDKTKMEVFESRMAQARDTATRGELALKFATERQDLNTEQKMREAFYSRLPKTMTPEKLKAKMDEIEGHIKLMNLPKMESSIPPAQASGPIGSGRRAQ